MLWVAEHGKILRGTSNRCLADGNLELCPADFDACLALLDEPEGESGDLAPIMTYSRPYGREQLKVANHVGLIRTEHDTHIEILPKISRQTDPSSARFLLVKMLIELEDSPFLEGTLADLSAHRMPLFEVLMALFLKHTAAIVRRGIARDYVGREDNLVFIRGKLGLSEHIKRNTVRPDRAWCHFDEFEMNRPINRLIRGALDVVARLTRDGGNRQVCRELLFWFDSVAASPSPGEDLKRVRMDRLIRHYEPAIPLCKLILERLNPLTERGNNRAMSVLFPMEKVFENYVTAKLPWQIRGWQVSCQISGQSLVESHDGRRIFNLVPDLAFRRSDQLVIADTKWKLLDGADRANKYQISQADMYQLFAYGKKYLSQQTLRELYLIYPMTETFRQPLKPFWYSRDSEVLWVLPYDLERDTLVLDPSCVIADSSEAAKAS